MKQQSIFASSHLVVQQPNVQHWYTSNAQMHDTIKGSDVAAISICIFTPCCRVYAIVLTLQADFAHIDFTNV